LAQPVNSGTWQSASAQSERNNGTNNPRAEKTEVFVVDHVDELVPMLARMVAKRRIGYRELSYKVKQSASRRNRLDDRENPNVPIIGFVDLVTRRCC
jgi:hypothetical protein